VLQVPCRNEGGHERSTSSRITPVQPKSGPSERNDCVSLTRRNTDPAYSGQSVLSAPLTTARRPTRTPRTPTDKLPQYWLQGQPRPDQSPAGTRARATKSATLALDRRGRGGASGYRIGHRPGDRQRHGQKANGRFPHCPRRRVRSSRCRRQSPSPSASAPGPATAEPSQPADASAMQTVVYNVSGDGRGHQHHLRRQTMG